MPGYARPPSYNANNISITPAGDISSTTLQAGLEEIDSEKTTENYVDTTVNTATAAVPTGRKNLLYNGAMQVAQRGTSTASIATAGYYTADRWRTIVFSLGTWTQSVEADGPTGSGFTKSLKMLCTTADSTPAASNAVRVQQNIEGQDLQRIAKGTASAQQVTISFWVKSNVTGTYAVYLYDNDNARMASSTYAVSASATWERKTITFSADTTGDFDNDNALSLQVQFVLAAGSNFTSGTADGSWAAYSAANEAPSQTNLGAATNNYWQITGVQLEVGDTATDFEHKPYGVELAECQRYYEKIEAASARMVFGHHQYMDRDTHAIIPIHYSPKRTLPTFEYGSVSSSSTGTASVTSVQMLTVVYGYIVAAMGGSYNFVSVNDYYSLNAEL